jgi:phosphoribosylformimino-5-aminoimidazole carboxamide ribotide isomerase
MPGCEWLHLVDLNGAFAGQPVNAAAVEAILGGEGPRPAWRRHPRHGHHRDVAGKGLARVILGTVAVENPVLVREAAIRLPRQGRRRHRRPQGLRRHQGLGRGNRP